VPGAGCGDRDDPGEPVLAARRKAMTKVRQLLRAISIATACSTTRVDAQTIPFDSDRWEIQARESKIETYLGRQSLYLKDGFATVRDANFENGVIEFDVAFSADQGFTGVLWRVQNLENYEEFYVRPHQSGNPDANQYHPVFNDLSAWQLYYGEDYSTAVEYDFNRWVHIKVVVSGKRAEVYIQDMQSPVLVINELKREIKPGKVGLKVSSFAPAYFSSFSFDEKTTPPLKGKDKKVEAPPAGMVMSWMVSGVIEGRSLQRKYQLMQADKQQLSWTRLASESSGLANLARLNGIKDSANTVFARLTIRSDRDQIKKVSFGFSDAVKVYFNDRLTYGGSDGYQSRDYRFLGTIGLFDEVYLPMKKGENELWFAVTENFGGWGIKAFFEDTDGIEMKAY
jgi:hypothetical protein